MNKLIKNERILMPFFDLLNMRNTNNGTKEMIDVHLKYLNPNQHLLSFPGRISPKKYIFKELQWYNSQSLSIKGYVDDIAIWKSISDKDGYVNSNYGWCIYSQENHKQYLNCLNTLLENKYTRRACMIYTRPSMQYDYNRDGMSDFMCTFNTQLFIRDNKLIYIINQRSCDMIYGFFNDFAWHCKVYNKIYKALIEVYDDLDIGYINYNIGSAHVYKKHYDMLKKMVNTNENNTSKKV